MAGDRLRGDGPDGGREFAKVALGLEPWADAIRARRWPLAVSGSVHGDPFWRTAGVIVARIGLRQDADAAIGLGPLASLAQALLPGRFRAAGAAAAGRGGASGHRGGGTHPPWRMAARSCGRARWRWGSGNVLRAGLRFVAVVVGRAAGTPRAGFVLHAVVLAALAVPLWWRLPPTRPPVAQGAGWPSWHGILEVATARPRVTAPALGFFWHTALFLGLLTFLPGFVGGWTARFLPLVPLVGTFGAGGRRAADRATGSDDDGLCTVAGRVCAAAGRAGGGEGRGWRWADRGDRDRSRGAFASGAYAAERETGRPGAERTGRCPAWQRRKRGSA